MPTIQIPNNWSPRDYQLPAWRYLENGGRHAELVWHRRSGKDEISLHHTCCAAFTRVANYWHMLPQANQARKAIWDAVNPHTGIRRIDEAFPDELRSATRDNDMKITFKNGSTWQVMGSDNFQSSVGSTPAGIVWSEWPQANPMARGYLRPIISENQGWQIFIGTPRGKNHGYKTLMGAKKDPSAFAQVLSVEQTKTMTADQLEIERVEYINTYGEAMGNALFEQEYLCSFDAAILGAVYGAEFRQLDAEDRICEVKHDPNYEVHTAWDIGFSDHTSIWFYQVINGEVRVIDYLSEHMKDPDWFCSQLLGKEVHINLIHGQVQVEYGSPIEGLEYRRNYRYGMMWLPHDGNQKIFSAKGKSFREQLMNVFGMSKVRRVPSLSRQDGIKATRKLFKLAVFDYDTQIGLDAIRQYRYDFSETKNDFSKDPVHDWTSHPADALRMLAVAYFVPKEEVKEDKPITGISNMSLDELWNRL